MSAKEIEAELSQKQNNKSKERHTAPHHRCGRAQNEARRKRGDIKAKACNALLPAGAARQTSLAALGAVAAYAAVRSSIKIFHHTRRHLLRQMLADLCRNLDHVTYWLDFGSLLGIHRDGDLILHDNDVDLAVLDPDWPALLAHLQRQMPQYCVRLETPSEAPDVCFLRVYCGVCFADVFGARSLGEGRVLVDCGHGDITSIDERLVLPTKALTWRCEKLYIHCLLGLYIPYKFPCDDFSSLASPGIST